MSVTARSGATEQDPREDPAGADPEKKFKQWDLSRGLVQGVVALWMNLLILSVAAVTAVTAGFLGDGRWPEQSTWGVGALKLFVLWCLAFLPGWLYIRFLHMRGLALWTEYVLVLHRLSWDRPWNLPQPPKDSDYFDAWSAGRRPDDDVAASRENIYRQKFEAYYGRTIPARLDEWRDGKKSAGQDFRVRGESLFPIFLATLVFAVGWAVCLWDTYYLDQPGLTVWVVLKYGFLGAYLFVLSMLVRRFFQSDLKPSAYASGVLRIILVLFIVVVLFHLLPDTSADFVGAVLATAFLIGFFPLVGLQFIRRAVAKLLGTAVPTITSDHPLDRLDGLNLWYEARLLEEGVEDMQNLATMNLVDVVLHTRVPTGRLIDWIDQAHLLLRLGPFTKKANHAADADTNWTLGAEARERLQRAGIRGATDLLRAYSNILDPHRPGTRPEYTGSNDPREVPLPPVQLDLLVSVLGVEEGLTPVWNWKANGVPPAPARPAVPATGTSGGAGHAVTTTVVVAHTCPGR